MAKTNQKKNKRRPSVNPPTRIKALSAQQKALFDQVNALIGARQLDQAGALLQQLLQQAPEHPDLLSQMGLVCFQTGRIALAEKAWTQVLRIRPEDGRSWYMLGCLYSSNSSEDSAINAFEQALKHSPGLVQASNNLGVLYKNQERYEEAAKCFEQVVAQEPNSAYALSNLGNVLKEAGYITRAMKYLRRAVEVQPDLAAAYSNLLVATNYQALPKDKIFELHREWSMHLPVHIAENRFRFDSRQTDLSKKLRIGFVSPDLHQHSVAYFVAPLFRQYDRENFEFVVYYNNTRVDEVTLSLKSMVDQWFSVADMDEISLADQIFDDRIDILIDLAGHTANNRLAVFAQKPAPIQVTWLGYPNTTGLRQIDYRFVDRITDQTSDAEVFHSEALFRFEHSFICYEPPEDAPPVSEAPCLKNGYVTFGSFNNLVKVGEETISAWAAVLNAVAGSKLLIKSRQLGNEMTRKRVLKLFQEQGISAERLELVEHLASRADHLKLYERIDIALDTFPYNGTTTTCEALWMGVPVISVLGDRHAARVSASLLKSVGLDDFVSPSFAQLVEVVRGHTSAPDRLNERRANLRQAMKHSALCDAPAFARMFEQCLRAIARNE